MILAVGCGGAAVDDSESDDDTLSASGGTDDNDRATTPGSGGNSQNGAGGMPGSGGITSSGGVGVGGSGGDSTMTPATGGSATGGAPLLSSFEPLLPLNLEDATLGFAEIPLTAGIGSCTPPCAITLQSNEDESNLADQAFLYVDFAAPSVTLSNEDATSATGYEMRFSYEDNQYGHASWASGLWWVWSEGERFDGPDDYSEAEDRVFTAQLGSASTGGTLLIAYSHGPGIARVHWARIPTCTPATGVCENTSDCSAVNTGQVGELGAACSACYEAVRTCSQTHCSEQCPGQGGNVCMNCEVDAGCHTAFMECSGLDYMPMNSLTLPK